MSYELSNDVRYRLVLDEAVLVRQDAAEVVGLNLVGARILDLVKEGASEADMVRALAGEFEVETSVLETDVPKFLEELVSIGILRRS